MAATLTRDRSGLARSAVDLQFARSPGLAERLGPRGVEASVRDAEYNVDHLAEAIALGDPDAFATYLRWLAQVLVGARVPPELLGEHLACLAETIRTALGPEDAATAIEYLEHAESPLPEREASR